MSSIRQRLGWLACAAMAAMLAAVGFHIAARSAGSHPPTQRSDGSPSRWQERFARAYSLDKGEVVRLLPPPFIPERPLFINTQWLTPGTQFDDWQMCFFFDDQRGLQRHTISVMPGTLLSAARDCAGLPEGAIDIPAQLREIPVPGDWVVRARSTAPLQERLAGCERIVRAVTGRRIVIRIIEPGRGEAAGQTAGIKHVVSVREEQ